jgi:hypothetical protein
MTGDHRTSVVPTKAGYRARCESCGVVGQPQDFEADARAIAERHEAVGGFER